MNSHGYHGEAPVDELPERVKTRTHHPVTGVELVGDQRKWGPKKRPASPRPLRSEWDEREGCVRDERRT